MEWAARPSLEGVAIIVPHMTSSSSRADSGFAYSRDFFENLVDTALAGRIPESENE